MSTLRAYRVTAPGLALEVVTLSATRAAAHARAAWGTAPARVEEMKENVR